MQDTTESTPQPAESANGAIAEVQSDARDRPPAGRRAFYAVVWLVGLAVAGALLAAMLVALFTLNLAAAREGLVLLLAGTLFGAVPAAGVGWVLGFLIGAALGPDRRMPAAKSGAKILFSAVGYFFIFATALEMSVWGAWIGAAVGGLGGIVMAVRMLAGGSAQAGSQEAAAGD